jgi:hypothetical protein
MNRLAFFLGVALRSLVLGTLLFLAAMALVFAASDVSGFHYQGF